MKENYFCGNFVNDKFFVYVKTFNKDDLEELALRQDIKNYSDTFEWGNMSNASKQLSIAILSTMVMNEVVLACYEYFLKDIIFKLNDNKWKIDRKIVVDWLMENEFKYYKPKLTPRFQLKPEENYNIFLDNKKLGKKTIYNRNIDMYNDEIIIYCTYLEINHLFSDDLPVGISFDFNSSDDKSDMLSDRIWIYDICRNKNKTDFRGCFSILFESFKENKNLISVFENLKKSLLEDKSFTLISTEVEQGTVDLFFTYSINENKKLEDIGVDIFNKLNDNYLIVLNNEVNENKKFEAIFNLPNEYQSLLKQYLLYFEEFLYDLFIESNVSIQKIGLDTILTVDPKDKNEALEKIADALKMYLCAPIMVNGVSLKDSLEMKMSLTKLYAQCKHLESQMMYKELTLKEQNQQLELKDNIINESKRILIEAGVDTSLITQSNIVLLESLKSIKLNGKETKKNTFLSSIKVKVNVSQIFSGSLELKRDKI